MGENARDQVRAILAETLRRKQIWTLMQVAAREAVQAVTAEARRRGVRGQNWLGGKFERDHVTVSFPTADYRLAERLAEIVRHKAAAKPGSEDMHAFQLHGSGALKHPNKDTDYEGYPDLVDEDVLIFRHVAVERLMGALNAHLDTQRRHPKRR